MKGLITSIVFLTLSLPFINCGNNKIAGTKSGVETTNGFSGVVVDSNGNKIEGAIVTLYPEDFNPIESLVTDSMIDTTNNLGEYFLMASTNNYNISVLNPSNNTVALIQDLDYQTDSDSTVELSEIVLSNSGSVILSIQELNLTAGSHIYIPGTGVHVEVTSNDLDEGNVSITSIPPVLIGKLHYQDVNGNQSVNLLQKEIQIYEDVVVDIGPYFNWQYRFKVKINTSSSGANISEALINFPLLVRIDSKIITKDSKSLFELSDPGGTDIRFSNSRGGIIPFEIELWDAIVKNAFIWVSVDTIWENNDSQFIYLHTGNASASFISNSQFVFDTSNGFTGVWHLGDSLTGIQGNLSDETQNNFNGTAVSGFTNNNSKPAVVGKGLELDGSTNVIELPSTNLFMPIANAPITLSAWVKPDTFFTGGDSIHNRVFSMKSDTIDQSILILGFSEDGRPAFFSRVTDTVYNYTSPVTANNYYFLTLTFDGSHFKPYVNGVNFGNILESTLKGGTYPALLGCHKLRAKCLKGMIDEVRISNQARSESWIKMNFENQKVGSGIVTIE